MSVMKEEIDYSIANVKADTYCDECDSQFCNQSALEDHKRLLHDSSTKNPWNIQSLYDLQYFNCPSCTYKNNLKQEFIEHAYNFHPESSNYLNNISDGSMTDVEIPNEMSLDFKYDLENNFSNGGLEIKVEEFDYDMTNNQSRENDIIDDYNSDFEEEKTVKKVKNHKCDSCLKSFSSPMDLKRHINSVHNGQKDQKCDLCGKTFSAAGNLKRHIDAVHNGPM